MSRFCTNCGHEMAFDAGYCPNCGTPAQPQATVSQPVSHQSPLVGFTTRHLDPVIVARAAKTRKGAKILTGVLTLGFPIGFLIASQFSDELTTQEAFLVGLALGLMMLIIGLVQLRKTRGGTWDGTITNKKYQRKSVSDSNDDITQYKDYYTIYFTKDSGQKHKVTFTNSIDMYNYFSIGDRVRCHLSFGTYEKYDKSRDPVIYCNICGKRNDITQDTCRFCKLPLFK